MLPKVNSVAAMKELYSCDDATGVLPMVDVGEPPSEAHAVAAAANAIPRIADKTLSANLSFQCV